MSEAKAHSLNAAVHCALCSLHLSRYSWRDRALWIGAAFVVMTAYAGTGSALMSWHDTAQPIGGGPSMFVVQIAPEAAAPERQREEVAIGARSHEQVEVDARKAAKAIDDSDNPDSDAVGKIKEVKSVSAEQPTEDTDKVAVKQVKNPQDVEEVENPLDTIPDVIEAKDPAVVVPEAAPEAAPIETAESKQASVPREARKQSILTLPEIQDKVAEVAMAPVVSDIKSKTVDTSIRTWKEKLSAYLQKHKRYPSDLRNRREQGQVYLRFTIDGAGKVLAVSVKKSSGFSSLDDFALQLMKDISPVPAPPPAFTDADGRMTLAFAMNFELTR